MSCAFSSPTSPDPRWRGRTRRAVAARLDMLPTRSQSGRSTHRIERVERGANFPLARQRWDICRYDLSKTVIHPSVKQSFASPQLHHLASR